MATYDITLPTFDIDDVVDGDVLNCPYTGSEVTLELPAGKYRFNVSGASGNFGGNKSTTSSTYLAVGGGGSSQGTLDVGDNAEIYINVGGCGETYTGTSSTTRSGGYNGGGSAKYYGGVGGGATHVAFRSGLLSSLESYKSDIIIVAGGGGGSNYYSGNSNYYGNGGSGGGTSGQAGTKSGSANATYCGQGGTQTSGGAAGTSTSRKGTAGSFGQGGSHTSGSTSYSSSAGGGGYYGGGAGSNEEAGGGGGSGYVSSILSDASTSVGTSTTSYYNGSCSITVIEIYSITKHTLNLNLSGGNYTSDDSNGYEEIREGSSKVVSFIPLSSEDSVKAYINDIDVSSNLTTRELTSSLSITSKRPDADYGFNLSNGYYVSQNKGVAKSAAVARVNIVAVSETTVTFNLINYAEEGYDFGVLGLLDNELQAVYNSDNSGYWSGFSADHNTSSVQTVEYIVPIGEHFIDVKYIKDDATDSNNDTLQFKVSMNPAAGSTAVEYTLTTEPVYEDLDIQIICGDASNNFSIAASGEHASYYPKQVNVYAGSDYELRFNPTDTEDYRYLTVYDNNVDVGSSVVPPHTLPNPSYSVQAVSGASYGFALSSGYYQSQNNSNNTAALCKVVFEAPVRSLVTITYQNTGNGTNNFSMISELNTDLRTDSATDTSGIYMNGSSNFHSSDTDITYEIPAGQSYITCKHKISSNSGTKGNLKFKVAIQPLESLDVTYYSYSLSNIQSIHNIIIISQKIPEYTVNVTCGPMGTSSESGTHILKEGNSITITGIPDTNYVLSKVYANSISVPFSNNRYVLNNISQDMNIYLLFLSDNPAFYVKDSEVWVKTIQAYKKENDRWVTVDYSDVGDIYTRYIRR